MHQQTTTSRRRPEREIRRPEGCVLLACNKININNYVCIPMFEIAINLHLMRVRRLLVKTIAATNKLNHHSRTNDQQRGATSAINHHQ